MPHFRILAAVLLFVVPFPESALALQGGTPSEFPPLKATSRMVVVDVVVKDRKNAFVHGLGINDFEVLEDGISQKIASFNLNVDPTNISSAPIAPGNENGSANRVLPVSILLLDLLNTEPKDRPYGRQAMLQYIERHIKPGQRVAVFVLSGELMLLQDFTDDPKVLQNAIRNDRTNPLDPKIKDRDADDLERIAYMTGDGILMRMVEVLRRFEANVVAEKTNRRVESTLLALRSIARAAGGQPGRKSLVWVTGGFPLSLLSGTAPGMKELTSFQSPMKETSDLLNSSQIAVYPVDVRGLLALSPIPLEQQQSTQWVKNPKKYQEKTDRVPEEIVSPQDAMKEMAELTGGKAFINRNDLDVAIESAIADNSQSYTIGYYSSNKMYDGKFRKIKIRSTGHGFQLRFRRGYFALDHVRRQDSTDELIAALEQDPSPSTQIQVMANLEPDVPLAGHECKVKMFVKGSSLQFRETEKGMSTSLQFAVVAFNQMGEVVARRSEQGDTLLALSDWQRANNSGLLYAVGLILPKGMVRVRAGVRDRSTGRIGSAEFLVMVP